MKVKVCGLNNKQNITEVIAAGVDMIGLIFYTKSPRSIDKGNVDPAFVKGLDVKKVGVFVNEKAEVVEKLQKEYGLDYLQLHGHESSEYCAQMKKQGSKIIKAFSVSDKLDLDLLRQYRSAVDYFLFDTKGKDRGGNGIKFDWEALANYNLDTPFMLSGGIRLEDANDVKQLTIDKLWAADLNSGFEESPGLKKAKEVREFINTLD
ncbi:MAG: phosphoribosylanthranilate isomerase [Cyclobacteriaceae bacterium]